MSYEEEVERCPTGIPGFDKLCEGGLVRGSVNTIHGGPGAGKTTFLLQFLWNGKTLYGENGLFISFEPDITDIYKDANIYGWDFLRLESEGGIKFMKFSPKTNIRNLKTEITSLVTKYQITRVCMDPISVLAMNIEKENEIRELIFDLTGLLKRLNVTVLLSNETTEESLEGTETLDIKGQSLNFLSDGLINLHTSGLGGVSDRAVRVVKMRRTNHNRGPIPFQISKKGIDVLYTKR